MITGKIDAFRQAVIPLQIRGQDGPPRDLTATIDTGFSGFLTLPPTVITALQLPFDRTEIYTLGDSREVAFDLYRAVVHWDGQNRDIFVLATDCNPLVGMAILHGYTLFLDVIDGGEVRIEARS
jgi:clan AA aspartic protease